MSTPSQTESLLIGRIRAGDEGAWNELIGRYEGRLLAYVESRTGNRTAAEDIVQEAFIGFLTSLPNYDRRRRLESYLFSIAAHKLTDYLRREGRRPTLPLKPEGASTGAGWEPSAHARRASSIVRSGERRGIERSALEAALSAEIAHFQKRGQWEKLKCVELLFVRGHANKEVAEKLGISEQTVANYKFEFLTKLRTAVRKQRLPEEVFPELYEGE
jgi:RNA polymerase sigma-70 factor, ECF subfamily